MAGNFEAGWQLVTAPFRWVATRSGAVLLGGNCPLPATGDPPDQFGLVQVVGTAVWVQQLVEPLCSG